MFSYGYGNKKGVEREIRGMNHMTKQDLEVLLKKSKEKQANHIKNLINILKKEEKDTNN